MAGGVLSRRPKGGGGMLAEFEAEILPVHASLPPPHPEHLLNSSISLLNNAVSVALDSSFKKFADPTFLYLLVANTEQIRSSLN